MGQVIDSNIFKAAGLVSVNDGIVSSTIALIDSGGIIPVGGPLIKYVTPSSDFLKFLNPVKLSSSTIYESLVSPVISPIIGSSGLNLLINILPIRLAPTLEDTPPEAPAV